jgi:hypothetical protein
VGVVEGVVLGQDVAAEVPVGVAPDGVGVVALALDVVVLDQEPGALHPVVVGLAGLGPAGPREMEPLEAVAEQVGRLCCGELVG